MAKFSAMGPESSYPRTAETLMGMSRKSMGEPLLNGLMVHLKTGLFSSGLDSVSWERVDGVCSSMVRVPAPPFTIVLGRIGEPDAEGASILKNPDTIQAVVRMIISDQRKELEAMEAIGRHHSELGRKATFIKNIKARCMGIHDSKTGDSIEISEDTGFVRPPVAVFIPDSYGSIARVAGLITFEKAEGELYYSTMSLGEGVFRPLPGENHSFALGNEAVVSFDPLA